jgi:hypothetical protein
MAASQPGQVQRFLRMRLKEWQHRDNLACSGRLYAADPGGETHVLRLTPIRSSESNGHFNCLGTIPKNMAVEYDAPNEGGIADENHSWMCGARARFLNSDDSCPGEGLHQRRLDWRHSRALCRPSRLIGSCRRLRDRSPRSEPPETIKAAASELANEHGSLSLKRRLTHKRARLALSPISTSLAKSASERVRRSTL